MSDKEKAKLFDECAEARDAAGWLGHPADAIRGMDQDITNAQSRVAVLETELAASRADNARLREVAGAALKWIDAVPGKTELPAMPGFDRDWADAILASTAPDAPQPDLRAECMEEAARIADARSRQWNRKRCQQDYDALSDQSCSAASHEDEADEIATAIRAAIPARAGAPADDGWRDMASAPKDGEFLAALSNGWVVKLYHTGATRDPKYRYAWWGSTERLSVPYEPSHPADTDWSKTNTLRAVAWRPLPPPPREDAKP